MNSVPLVLFCTIIFSSLTHQAYVHQDVTYPDGPQGPDFALEANALKVDLLERDIDTFWNVENLPPGFYNEELQEYRADAVSQYKNAIYITARKTSEDKCVSGRINSDGKWHTGDFNETKKQGYLEIRARFPAKTDGGRFTGAWPAIWMLGTGNNGDWPGCGEINIMDTVNGEPSLVMSLYSTHHYGGNAQHPPEQPLFANADFSRDGAILGLEWNVQDSLGQIDITWWITYYDLGTKSWTSMHTTSALLEAAGEGNDYQDFYNTFVESKGFYAVINLAEGGVAPQCLDYSCVFVDDRNQYLIVDSAKVYGI